MGSSIDHNNITLGWNNYKYSLIAPVLALQENYKLCISKDFLILAKRDLFNGRWYCCLQQMNNTSFTLPFVSDLRTIYIL